MLELEFDWVQFMQLREYLRRETRLLHRQVEALFERVDIATPVGLHRFLLAHHAAVAPIENRLAAVSAPWADCWPYQLTSLLRRDLEAPNESWQLPTLPTKQLGGLATAHPLGLCYVLGGSRLGARVLLRRLSDGHGAGSEPPAYLAQAPDEEIWARTQRLLATPAADAASRVEILNAAETAFTIFGHAVAWTDFVQERADALAV